MMDENTYRRNVIRGDNYTDSPPRDGYRDQYRSSSLHSPSSSQRSQAPPSINLKTLKNTSLICAKTLTNKLISLSNCGLQAASTAINSYKETAAANAKKAAIANPNSFLRISQRISSTNDPISSHRELVAVIEHLLIWSSPPVQLTLERDRYGLPTTISMRNIQLINTSLLEKVLVYVEGRRDCCIFIVKFVTWRIRTTTLPEEVLLSLELMQHCVEKFGGYFLALMTKSCMKRFRRLLRMTKLTTSLAGGVKKQLTKLIIGSSNMHPGVPTDVRIHVIKAKVLYMVQLWHDVFLLDQGMYPVFFQGYREMRERGIRFPQIDVTERAKINTSPVIPKAKFSMGNNIVLPLTPDELDVILSTVQTINTVPPGPQREAALDKLRQSKERIVASINILVEKRSTFPDPRSYEDLMMKMLMLNDCVGAHLHLGAAAGGGGSQSSSQLLSKMEASAKSAQSTGQRESADSNKANLLDLDSSSDSDNNEDFDKFFGIGTSETQGKKNEDDYDKFFAEFGVFSTASKEPDQSPSTKSDSRKDYSVALDSLNFGNPVAASIDVLPSSTRSAPAMSSNTTSNDTLSNLDYDPFSITTDSSYVSALSSGRTSIQPPAESSSIPPSTSIPATSETKDKPAEAEPKKKTLNELMNDLDNMDHDFSHMSVTGF